MSVPALDLGPAAGAGAPPEAVPRAGDDVGSKANARLRRMVSAYASKLWVFLRRLGIPESDIEDVLQEVILVTANRLNDIAEGAERAFLYSTAYRVAAKWRRRVARHHEVLDDALEHADPSPQPDAALEDREALALLEAVLSAMPIELRAVFVLYEIEEHTMAEISEVLELAPGTTASRLRRARASFDERIARLRAQQRRQP
jgi:RNA polymerase sigma-70 factor, ECF subfamily